MLATLRTHDELLADPHSKRLEQQPDYARNEWRSIKPDVAVLVAICTHLGCIPTFRPQPGAADIDASWPGGFYCPCHGSKFDLAGRVFKNVPAPSNLEVPPHRYRSDSVLLIGEGPAA
jgi:ubiquinol-cytochrome c reductase iron-sulfur subunit